MLSHIASDLHQVYLEEVFKPQLGKPGASTPPEKKSSSDLDSDGDVDSFEKKVRQFIYDVRHLMRKNNIPVERAFQIRSAKTKYGAEVIKTAKEKLGIKSGGTTSVSEESSERMVKVTINYKNGTIDRRNVPYSEISTLRAKPTISSVEVSSNKVTYAAGEKYEKKYGRGGKNTVGDADGDGTKEPNSHEYAGVKDRAIKKAMFRDKSVSKKRKLKSTYGVSEGFSNWREDLKEVAGVNDEIATRKEKQITEKPVDNYKDKSVVINPDVTEEILGGQIVESFELSEDYIFETVDIATEFFYNCELNENGIDIVIEELGENKFNEFIFDLAEEYFLSEERSAKKRKGGKSYEEIKAEIDKKEAAKKKITADKTKKAVEKAKETQAPSSKKSTEDKKKGIAGKIFGALKDRAAKDTELLKKTVDTARKVGERRAAEGKAVYDALRERGKKAEQSATATRARRKAKVAAGRAVQSAAPVAKKAAMAAAGAAGAGAGSLKAGKSPAAAAGRAAGTFVRKMKEELELQEKAESEQQQKLFGLALSVKRGETPRSEASAEVLKIVDTMSEKKIRDFAKTKHEGIPKKVEEALSNPRGASSQKKSPKTTQKQQETGRIRVLQKLLDLEKGKRLSEEGETIGEGDSALDAVLKSYKEKYGEKSVETGTRKQPNRKPQKMTPQKAKWLSSTSKHLESSPRD
jgi:hypothetical protein